MFIPEPFSLTLGIMGVIGFLSTVRNGIEKLAEDTKKWKRYGEEIVIIDNRTKWEMQEMTKWADIWMVWKGEDQLLEEFWGDNGRDEIYRLTEAIAKLCRDIEGPMDKYLLHSEPRRKVFGLHRKAKWVVEGAADMKRQVEKLEGLVRSVKAKALHYFKTRRGLEEDPTMKFIHDIGNLRHLTSLAMATCQVSEDIKEACINASPSHTIDLELNLFNITAEQHLDRPTTRIVGPSEGPSLRSGRQIRSKAISDSAANGRLNFIGLVKRKPQTGMENEQVLRICISNMPPNTEPGKDTFRDSLLSACQDIRNGQHGSGWHVFGSNRFHVLPAFNEYSDGYADWPSFKEVLWRSIGQPSFDIESPIRMKVKLAFELAECGFVFLRTSWLSNLCSCTLRERRPQRKCHHVLRGGDPGHFHPTGLGYRLFKCWSENDVPQPIQGVGLRHLGLLLSEIALGCPIVSIKALESQPNELKYVRMFGPPPGEPKIELLSQLPVDVFNATNSVGFKKAVTFCLNNKSSWGALKDQTDAVQRKMLKEYYWGVLMPLHVDLEELNREEIRQGE